MIVVGIIGILAAIAVPQYQDYVIRAKIAEGLQLAGAVKVAAEEFYSVMGVFPMNNPEAGLERGFKINGKYVRNVYTINGIISIYYRDNVSNTAGASPLVWLRANVSNEGSITWKCVTQAHLTRSQVPNICRK